MKKILLVLVVLAVSLGTVFGYNITNKDDRIIDKIEDKLIAKIDNNSRLTPEIVVSYIDKILSRNNLSQRVIMILEVVVDDIEYVYGIGAYALHITMTADQCYEDEFFDDRDQRCYFDESNYQDDNEQNYQIGDQDQSAKHEDSESEVLATYKINSDSIELLSGKDQLKHQEIWEIFTTLIPLSVRSDFLKYSIINDMESDTGAHVEQDENDNLRWNMTVNLDSFYDNGKLDTKYAYSTLIHEFAHVLTLNKTQVRYYPITDNEDILSRFDENCVGNLLQEGCLNEDAYLDDFIDNFWSDKNYLKKVRNEEISAYLGNESSFVNDYAATNPGEDIAETFTYFVTQIKPTGSSIADKKILFFYEYIPLKVLRKQIRLRLEQIN